MIDEWKKCRHIFKKPKLYWYFGFWKTPKFVLWAGNLVMKNNPESFKYKLGSFIVNHIHSNHCLPIWRMGNIIKLFKGKVTLKLPYWLSCHVFKIPLLWKWKYDDVRFEYPPQFTIVLFNISLSFWFNPSKTSNGFQPDMYWESILHYNYLLNDDVKRKSIREQVFALSDELGYWFSADAYGNKKSRVWGLQPEFLKDKKLGCELERYQHQKIVDYLEKKEAKDLI